MPVTLNDFCFSLDLNRTVGADVRTGGIEPGEPTRAKVLGPLPSEYSGTILCKGEQEYDDLLTLFATRGYSRSIAWQSPDDSAPVRYRFTRFQTLTETANSIPVAVTLERVYP
jgi:phage-related protein